MNIKIALALVAILIACVIAGYQAGYQAAVNDYEDELINIRERIRQAEADIEKQEAIIRWSPEVK